MSHEPLTEIPTNWKPLWTRHNEDPGLDEVRILSMDTSKAPHLRLVHVLRYKTSGMSGDEWRVSVLWQQSTDLEVWVDFDGPYNGVETGLAALFPGVVTSHEAWWGVQTSCIEFYWKGLKVYESTNDGKSQALLLTVGCAPWAHIIAGEECRLPTDWHTKCFQPGCSRDATSIVLMKQQYGRDGTPRSSVMRYSATDLRVAARAFCPAHRRRGDCGLDDADANYLHVSGTTLEQETGTAHFESPAMQVIYDLRGEGS